MEQFESLLTCCVCLDRFKNPKLLPCQHSYCMEPCMDGLIDYVRRQVKCPECRAEHRIPYQGVQGFPTNVTLQRFLELHAQIAGELPDPTEGQVMERCNVCSEKAYCGPCAHCDKKVCPDCKSGHMEVLRREIARINNQIRRGVHRLQDILAVVTRNTTSLQTNCAAVAGEVDEIHKRLAKALKDRTDFLRNEIDRYLATELRNLTNLKDNLELELSNINSNSDLAEKYMNEDIEWDDTELVDTKEIFLKTVEFLRNFDYEAGDYSRRIRFIMTHDPNQLVLHVASYGELNITHPGAYPGALAQTQALTRSKSDHRLATQFRQQEEIKSYLDNEEPLLGGRKFGERRPPPPEKHARDYGAADDYSGYESEHHRPSRRFRSRFVKSHQLDNDSDSEVPTRSARTEHKEKEKEKVTDTEEATRGPLSGIFRLGDCPRVMQKILDVDSGKKKEKKEVPPPPKPQPAPQQPQRRPPAAQRQPSEDDEITRLKRQNKGAATSQEPVRPTPQAEEERSSLTRKPPTPAREASTDGESEEEVRPQRKSSTPAQKQPPAGRRPSASEAAARPARAPSTDSSASTDSATATATTAAKSTGPASANGTAARSQSRFVSAPRPQPSTETAPADSDTSSEEETDSSDSDGEAEAAPARKPESTAMARSDIGPLLARSSNARNDAHDNNSKETAPTTRYRTRPQTTSELEEPPSRYGSTSRYGSKPKEDENTSSYDDDTKYPTARSRYLALKERRNRLARSKSSHTGFGVGDDDDDDHPVSPTTASPSAYLASRYSSGAGGSELSRSRSSHALKSRESSPERPPPGEKDGAALSSWARYLKNKYGSRGKERDPAASNASRRLSLGLPLRSASELASSDDDSKNAAGSPCSPTATAAVAGFAAAGSTRSVYAGKRRLQFCVGSRGSEPGSFTWPRGVAVGPNNSIVVADSSNHRVQVFDSKGIFVREFGGYGSGRGEFDCLAGVAVNRIGQYIIADRYNHRVQVFDPSGAWLRSFGTQGTGDGKFNYPWGVATDALGFIYVCDKENHRVQVFQSDGTFVGKFGSFGSGRGQLEHPHYVAVSCANRVLVSDSNNHRVQLFDVNGQVLQVIGSEGDEPGQFKFPRGVAVDEQGYMVVADSGNNRIQIFAPDGSFLRAFGGWGAGDGQFKGLEGVAIMAGPNIVVCDRENHRVQVF